MNNKYRERAKKLYNKQIDKWTVGEYIGEGKSAFVCEAYCRRRKYAIKIYLDEIIERSKEGEIENRIQRQLALIKHKHNNLIKIYGGGFCHINKCYYLADLPPRRCSGKRGPKLCAAPQTPELHR